MLPNARVLIALGQFAYQALAADMGLRPRPPFAHGLEVGLTPSPDRPSTILCSYHVSQQNTVTGKLTASMLDEVLDRARTLAER
jgi:uracil-DNA glycosylase